MKLKNLITSLTAALALSTAPFAGAITISLDTDHAAFITGASAPDVNKLVTAGSVFSPAATAADFTSVYKNSSGTEEGSLASCYSVSYSITPNGGNATITWTGGSLLADATFLLAKDGNMGSYLWDVRTWNGMDTLFIANPWLADQDVLKTFSHIEIYGGTGSPTPPSVPDGGATVIMLGAALAGIACFRRK